MKNRWYAIGWLFSRSISRLLFGVRPIGTELVPQEGPVIVAANHQSYLDPPILGSMITREMHFFAKKELFGIFIFGWLVSKLNTIPVKRGTYDPGALNRVIEVLAGNGGLILFPEGTRGDGREFLQPKAGIGFIAKQARAPIVPAYLHGTNRLFKAIFARRRVKVVFGEPISAEEIERFPDTKEGYRSLAERIMEHIGRLRTRVFSG